MAIQDFHFVPGELYLFSLDPRRHDPDRCLWGIFDKLENGNVVLEVMTDGLTRFYGRLRPSRIRIRQAGDPQRTQRFLFQLRAPERENRRIKSSADNPHRRISHPSTGDLDRNLQAMHFIRKMHRIMETTERKPRFRKIVRTAGIVVVAVLLLLAGANLWIGRIVRQKIEKEVAEQTGGTCRISIDRVRFNPVGRSMPAQRHRPDDRQLAARKTTSRPADVPAHRSTAFDRRNPPDATRRRPDADDRRNRSVGTARRHRPATSATRFHRSTRCNGHPDRPSGRSASAGSGSRTAR